MVDFATHGVLTPSPSVSASGVLGEVPKADKDRDAGRASFPRWYCGGLLGWFFFFNKLSLPSERGRGREK